MTQTDFHHSKPIYEYFPGWHEDISGARSLQDLPHNAQQYIKALEELAGVRISGVGVGPGRDEVIQVRDLISEDYHYALYIHPRRTDALVRLRCVTRRPSH